jgi:hypothetical protein
MQKWEGKVVVAGSEKVANRLLNEAGEEGWEAVGIGVHSASYYVIALKRPKG